MKELTIDRNTSFKELKELLDKYGTWETDKNIENMYKEFERVEEELFKGE